MKKKNQFSPNLQDNELQSKKEIDELRTDKNELETTKSAQDERIAALNEKCLELEAKLHQQRSDYEELQTVRDHCEARISELQAMHDTLKSRASNLESSLVEENMFAQKQVIDLQSALNRRNSSEVSTESITFDELKSIIAKTLNYETSSANNSLKLYLDAFLKSVKDTYQHLSDIEVNRNNLMKQFESVSTEKATLQHEYKTLKADLHHYEEEVSELMKNNGILLTQLENIKAGKLETISENNEDSILRMETQLDEANKLNASLQEDFNNLSRKLDESEEEKYELMDKISRLQQQLDEIRTDDSKLEIQRSFDETLKLQNEKIAELTAEAETLKAEQEEKLRLIAEIEEVQRLKQLQADELEQLQRDFDNLKEDFDRVQDDLENEKAKHLEQIDELNKSVEEFKERVSSNDDEQSQSAEIQQKLELLVKEKQELVNAIQIKHNENVQYHAKLQELNQMLMTLQQTVTTQSQQLSHQTEQLTASHNEIATLTDQVTFLKEKSDILAHNLLTEQTNQKLLQQEKIQLNDEKQILTKDLNRLREHLIEMENAHTAEMIELQNMLEITKQELGAMQEEARKSNTAYTSAR